MVKEVRNTQKFITFHHFYGPGGYNSSSWRRCWQLKSKLASKLESKVQAGTVQLANRCMTTIFYRKMVALDSIIIRNAGAATRIWYIRNFSGVGGPVHPTISMAGQRIVTLLDWKSIIDFDRMIWTLRKRYLIDPVEATAVMLRRLLTANRLIDVAQWNGCNARGGRVDTAGEWTMPGEYQVLHDLGTAG
jgi:hypothetical protein